MAAISEAMQKAINDQITKEIYSAYVYLSMSAWTAEQGLMGMSNWFKMQWQEELGHGMRLFEYLIDRNVAVKLQAIEQPPQTFESPLAIFEESLKHEQEVTKSINNLMDLAIREKDHASHNMLEWFVNEQVEEEAQAQEVIDRLKIIGGEGSGLLVLDLELGKRAPEEEGAEEEE